MTIHLSDLHLALEFHGDIIFFHRDGIAWRRLPIGTTNQVLTVAGGLPVWAAAAAGGIATARFYIPFGSEANEGQVLTA